jgi:hypothetical protein
MRGFAKIEITTFIFRYFTYNLLSIKSIPNEEPKRLDTEFS